MTIKFKTICVQDCDTATLEALADSQFGAENNITIHVHKEAKQCFQCHHQCKYHCSGKNYTDCQAPRGTTNPCKNVKVLK